MAYVLLQNDSESGHVVHQIKENEEKKTCPHPSPSHIHKKDLILTLPDTTKINVKVILKDRLPTCEHKLSHFEHDLPKIKPSNSKHNQESPHVHYNSNGLHIFVVHY